MAIAAGWYDHFDIARYTSWRVGGTVRALFKPKTIEDLSRVLAQRPDDEPHFWLGLGSNLLMPDDELDALVIYSHQALDTITVDEQEGLITVMAGVPCAKLAKLAAKLGDERAAFWVGIPGTMGGALRMNAGCYGHETWDFVRDITLIDRQGALKTYPREAIQTAYREAVLPKGSGIVQARIHYRSGPPEPGLAAIKKLLQTRLIQQPIGQFSCGSVFRNPPGDFAARLIESCHLKGHSIGDAQVSLKHANFIINKGQATAKDIKALIDLVQDRVAGERGITLTPEVQILGQSEWA